MRRLSLSSEFTVELALSEPELTPRELARHITGLGCYRTSNGFERLNKEIKRRTKVATVFPDEASLLQLVTAIVSDVSEEWETGRI